MSPRHRRAVASPAEALAYAQQLLGTRADVVGVDIGPKYRAKRRTERVAVRVHVVKKRARREVHAFERIPADFLGFPSDVVEARYRRHAGGPPPSGRFDALQAGISVGSEKAEAGTLGLLVFDRATGKPCILGSWHVLSGPLGAVGDRITQPARLDGGSVATDVVATLTLAPSPGLWGDAAVAELTGNRAVSSLLLGTNVRIEEAADPVQDQLLAKSGRTTGVTRGRVEGIGTYYYPGAEQGIAGCRIVPELDDPRRLDLAAPGDSGAVYYDVQTNQGIGLHCAGGIDAAIGEVAVACRLTTVLAVLGVTLLKAAD